MKCYKPIREGVILPIPEFRTLEMKQWDANTILKEGFGIEDSVSMLLNNNMDNDMVHKMWERFFNTARLTDITAEYMFGSELYFLTLSDDHEEVSKPPVLLTTDYANLADLRYMDGRAVELSNTKEAISMCMWYGFTYMEAISVITYYQIKGDKKLYLWMLEEDYMTLFSFCYTDIAGDPRSKFQERPSFKEMRVMSLYVWYQSVSCKTSPLAVEDNGETNYMLSNWGVKDSEASVLWDMFRGDEEFAYVVKNTRPEQPGSYDYTRVLPVTENMLYEPSWQWCNRYLEALRGEFGSQFLTTVMSSLSSGLTCKESVSLYKLSSVVEGEISKAQVFALTYMTDETPYDKLIAAANNHKDLSMNALRLLISFYGNYGVSEVINSGSAMSQEFIDRHWELIPEVSRGRWSSKEEAVQHYIDVGLFTLED